MNDDYHFIQRKVLNDLLFANRLRFSDIKPTNMEGSLFTFHLNKLIDLGLILKEEEGYKLTPAGKNIANTFDKDSKQPKRQAKHSAVFCAFKIIEGKTMVLIYTRKKNPFYDHQGFPTGKVMYGESILETAERELFEESGLSGKAKLVGIRHFRVYFPTKDELVEDKVMYICRIDNPFGEIKSNLEGEFYWVNVDQIKNIVINPLPEFYETLEIVTSSTREITFDEINLYPKSF